MADIDKRFNQDMLVLTGPVEPLLARQGVDVARDVELLSLLEPDTLLDAYRLLMVASPAVLTCATRGMTPAHLARAGIDGRLDDLAAAALALARKLNPQHILVELEPCGLPLDGSSATSMKEYRDDYVQVARTFAALDRDAAGVGAGAFDGYLLSGFGETDALKAALAGIRKVTDKPLFASVTVDADGLLLPRRKHTLAEAVQAMSDYGADVCGIQVACAPDSASRLVERVADAAGLPVLVELQVDAPCARPSKPAAANPYPVADTMVDAALMLRAAGAQFLRATGQATPAYTAALTVAVQGQDVRERDER